MLRCSIALLLLAGAGCAGDLPPAFRVDKLRVLAVRAEPPEVAPGEAVAVDALVALPPPRGGDPAPAISRLWLACRQLPSASPPVACGVGGAGGLLPDDLAADGAAPDLLHCSKDPEARLCGLGTGEAARYAPPASALGDGDRGEVILTLVAADAHAGGAIGCALAARGNGGAPVDPDHCVIALKRLVVSRAARPNRNPTLTALDLDGRSLLDGSATFALAPAKPTEADAHPLRVTRAPGSAEPLDDGRYEVLLAQWFATAGTIKNLRTSFQRADCDDACQKTDLDATTATPFTAPTPDGAAAFAPDGQVLVWVVVRDDRGGVAWLAGRAAGR